jgi:hypothetical protein
MCQGYVPPPVTFIDGRRRTIHAPEQPATKHLKDVMAKLGSVNDRHEALVRRVDAIEVRDSEVATNK